MFLKLSCLMSRFNFVLPFFSYNILIVNTTSGYFDYWWTISESQSKKALSARVEMAWPSSRASFFQVQNTASIMISSSYKMSNKARIKPGWCCILRSRAWTANRHSNSKSSLHFINSARIGQRFFNKSESSFLFESKQLRQTAVTTARINVLDLQSLLLNSF